MKISGCVDVLTQKELEDISRNGLRILSEVGLIVENKELLDLLCDWGAEADKEKYLVKFPVKLLGKFLDESSQEYDEQEGLEVSCTLPYGKRAAYARGVECTAGTYPQYYLFPNGDMKPHTSGTVADMTRLADSLDNIDRLGTMGIPSDLPAQLAPLYMRLIAWKHAEKKLSGCGEVHNPKLIPYIIEMSEIIAEYKKEPLARYAFAEIELISPLKLARQEAEIFTAFWKRNLKCGIGFMYTAGGTSPVTLASTVSLMTAESIFINILYRLCYGLKKLWFQCNSSAMDMKVGMFPFGRPERGLMILAMGQLARHFKAGLWASAVYPDAKVPCSEAGMQSAFNTIPAILAGSLGLECFGLLSSADIGSPIQLIIDNEYAGALKHFARGFKITEEELAFDLIKETGPGGIFIDKMHTAENYRNELWEPQLFSREPLNTWLAAGKKTDVDKAREIYEEVLKNYHPQGMDDKTEKRLKGIVGKAEKEILS